MNWLSFLAGAGITAIVAVLLFFILFGHITNKIIKTFWR